MESAERHTTPSQTSVLFLLVIGYPITNLYIPDETKILNFIFILVVRQLYVIEI